MEVWKKGAGQVKLEASQSDEIEDYKSLEKGSSRPEVSDRELKAWIATATFGRRTVRYLTLTVGATKNVGWNYICGSLLRLQKMLSQVTYFSYWGKGDARHVHLLVVAPWLSQATWSDLWRLCSKYRVVYIKSVPDIDKLIEYIRVHPDEVKQFVYD